MSIDEDERCDVEQFIRLVDLVRIQVEGDPSGYEENPHLYGLLYRIYLRLCRGNVPEFAVGSEGL